MADTAVSCDPVTGTGVGTISAMLAGLTSGGRTAETLAVAG